MADTPTLLLSCISALTSLVALIRTRRTQEKQLELQEKQSQMQNLMQEQAKQREYKEALPIFKYVRYLRLSLPYEGHEVTFKNLGGKMLNIRISNNTGGKIRVEPTDIIDTNEEGKFHFVHPIDTHEFNGNPNETWDFVLNFKDRFGNPRSASIKYLTRSAEFQIKGFDQQECAP